MRYHGPSLEFGGVVDTNVVFDICGNVGLGQLQGRGSDGMSHDLNKIAMGLQKFDSVVSTAIDITFDGAFGRRWMNESMPT
jgi:hypothetical protein